METNPNDFIQKDLDPRYGAQNGLTKREYFAALALQGIVARASKVDIDRIQQNFTVQYTEVSVKLADALIESLNKEQE